MKNSRGIGKVSVCLYNEETDEDTYVNVEYEWSDPYSDPHRMTPDEAAEARPTKITRSDGTVIKFESLSDWHKEQVEFTCYEDYERKHSREAYEEGKADYLYDKYHHLED